MPGYLNGGGVNVAEVVPSLKISSLQADRVSKVESLVEGLIFSSTTAAKIRAVFEAEMDLGLSLNPTKKSSLEMVNTYVPQLPNGTEEGKYLALDLGGTNFRTILVELVKGRLVKEEVKYFEVPEALRLGPGPNLFDFLAASIHQFLKEQGLLGEHLDLGFTFSFPMHQKSLRSGILVTWTKSFNSPGVTGKDVVVLLEEAIQRRGDLRVHVATVLNDTTGTLIQGAYLDPTCAIGLILGTGSNACYIERSERILNWEGERPPKNTEVIMDIEWGAFGDNGVLDFIKTDYDRAVDDTSLLPKSFTFEKYIAGKYLGEIVRVILLKIFSVGLLFENGASEKFLSHGAITTRHVSLIEEDSIKNSSEHSVAILKELELQYKPADIEVLKYVCYVVSNRAAKLVSICLAALLDRMARPGSVMIAVDGSLFQFHPRFKALMEKYISEFAPLRKFHLMLVEDGSGKGAGLTTAIATRLEKEH